MLPDKATMCHRTGFLKTCFECVTQHGCRLWKHIQLEHDPASGRPGVDHFDCLDSLMDLYARDGLRRQVQTTASVDSLRKEVGDSNDAGMAHALAGLNRNIQRISEQESATLPAMMPQRMIGAD